MLKSPAVPELAWLLPVKLRAAAAVASVAAAAVASAAAAAVASVADFCTCELCWTSSMVSSRV